MSQRLHDRVLYEVKDRVAYISLDRPERLNAFDGAMYLSLIHISEPTRLGMLSRMPSSA